MVATPNHINKILPKWFSRLLVQSLGNLLCQTTTTTNANVCHGCWLDVAIEIFYKKMQKCKINVSRWYWIWMLNIFRFWPPFCHFMLSFNLRVHDKITFSNYFVFSSKTTLSTSGLEVQGATKTGTICQWFWHKCTVVKRGSLSQI